MARSDERLVGSKFMNDLEERRTNGHAGWSEISEIGSKEKLRFWSAPRYGFDHIGSSSGQHSSLVKHQTLLLLVRAVLQQALTPPARCSIIICMRAEHMAHQLLESL